MKVLFKDHRGSSFVELVLVIALIAIIISASLVGIKLMNNKDSEKAIKTIESSIDMLTINTRSKTGDNWHLIIENTGTSKFVYIMQDTNVIEKAELTNNVVMRYKNGATFVEAEYAAIWYSKKGELEGFAVGPTQASVSTPGIAEDVVYIQAENASGQRTINLKIIKASGKHSIE